MSRIIPISEIKIEKNPILTLYAVVVHVSNHYTCYIKCGKNWFYYNDVSSDMKYIGTYEDMLNAGVTNPQTHGVLYFYKV